jgi:hypothetical protein
MSFFAPLPMSSIAVLFILAASSASRSLNRESQPVIVPVFLSI